MSDFLTAIKEKIPGTTEYQTLSQGQRAAIEIMKRWSSGELVYSQLKTRLENNRDFYLGKNYRQFNGATKEGELEIVVNLGGTVVDLIVYLLSNNLPTVQAVPRNTDKASQVEASVAEDLVNTALKESKFKKKFKNSCWLLSIGGFSWWYPFWNEDVEFGRKKNKFDFTVLNPFTTRVFYEDTDYEKISSFVTYKRLTPEAIYEIYGIEARPDSENIFLPETIKGEGISDQKVSVFKQYDKKYCTTVIDARVVKTEEHGIDFTPLIQTNNKFVVNDPHGHDDIYRMLPVAQELNMLASAASEIARDLAWPPLLEYNGAMGNRKPPKMRGQKISVRRTDKGEALEYMINPSQIEPILKQIQLLLDLFHFVSLMPKAAAGIFDSSVTSGFQAKLAMQPATLLTEGKKIDMDESIERLAKIALYLIEKNDPKALEIDENTRLERLYDLNFQVVWPDNLPIDIAREVQNLVLGIQNSLTSVTQSIDKYNVMMGLGSTQETIDYLKAEAEDPMLAPDRVLKVAQVKQTFEQINQSLDSMRQKLGVDIMPDEIMPQNENNQLAAAGSPLPEEQQQTQPGAEGVPLESTGGVLPQGGQLGV
jgi:hypothetical protein